MFDHTCNFRIPADGLDLIRIRVNWFCWRSFEDEDGILIYGAFASFEKKNLKTAILKSFRPVLKEFLKSLKN
jgi:hypothetical protein